MGIWKTIKQEKPPRYQSVFVLTRNNHIVKAFYCPEDKKFWHREGYVRPMSNYKRWCRESELVQQALNEINS